jgi:hypothetical protein
MPRTFCNPDLQKAHSFASYETIGNAEDLPWNPDLQGMVGYITPVGKTNMDKRIHKI